MYNAVPYGDLVQWHEDYNAVFAAAVACGASRVATVRVDNTFHPSSKYWIGWQQWHDPIAHRANKSPSSVSGEHPQDTLVLSKLLHILKPIAVPFASVVKSLSWCAIYACAHVWYQKRNEPSLNWTTGLQFLKDQAIVIVGPFK